MKQFREVTDEEWALIAPLFPELHGKRSGARRRTDPRAIFNGVLWVLSTRSAWTAMPPGYPSYRTCYGRYWIWFRTGVLGLVADELSESLGYDLRELMRMRRSGAEALRAREAIATVHDIQGCDLYAVSHLWTRHMS